MSAKKMFPVLHVGMPVGFVYLATQQAIKQNPALKRISMARYRKLKSIGL